MRVPSWRALGLAWAGVGLAAAGALGALAWLGPPPPPRHAAPPAAAPARPVRDARNDTPWPGPARAGGTAIAPPDRLLLEPAADEPGAMLPRIGPGGRRPSAAYAAARPPGPGVPIGVLVAGLGLDRSDSFAAAAQLPAPVDFAISPYAVQTGPLLDALRGGGHEYLLALPMEPAGYPSDDEGTHELLTSATPAQNARNLEWSLSRVQGYAGVTTASDGQDGARFLQSPALVATLAAELARRGLFLIDAHPGDPPLPGAAGRVADVTVPADADAAATDAALAGLEAAARARGGAIGVLFRPAPAQLGRLAAWAGGLRARGMVLVPLSALLTRAAP